MALAGHAGRVPMKRAIDLSWLTRDRVCHLSQGVPRAVHAHRGGVDGAQSLGGRGPLDLIVPGIRRRPARSARCGRSPARVPRPCIEPWTTIGLFPWDLVLLTCAAPDAWLARAARLQPAHDEAHRAHGLAARRLRRGRWCARADRGGHGRQIRAEVKRRRARPKAGPTSRPALHPVSASWAGRRPGRTRSPTAARTGSACASRR